MCFVSPPAGDRRPGVQLKKSKCLFDPAFRKQAVSVDELHISASREVLPYCVKPRVPSARGVQRLACVDADNKSAH